MRQVGTLEGLDMKVPEQCYEEASAPREVTFHQPWGKMAGLSWGDAGGPAVLCLHGLGDNAASFLRLGPLISPGRFVLALDMAGQGRSDHYPPSTIPSFFSYIKDIRRVLDQLPNIRKVSLVCHSLGSQTGLYMGAVYPGTVESIALVDPFLAPPCADPSLTADRVLKVLEMGLDLEKRSSDVICTPEEALKRFHSEKWCRISGPLAKAIMERNSIATGDGRLLLCADRNLRVLKYPLLTGDGHLGLVSAVRCPVLVLASHFASLGAVDGSPLRASLDALAPRLQLVSLKSSHFIHFDDPQLVAKYVNPFLPHTFVHKL